MKVGLKDGDWGPYRGDVGRTMGGRRVTSARGRIVCGVRLRAGEVGECVGDVALRERSEGGDVEYGEVTSGEVA